VLPDLQIVLENEEGGVAVVGQFLFGPGERVSIDFDEDRIISLCLSEFFEFRFEIDAWSTPTRVQVNDDWLCACAVDDFIQLLKRIWLQNFTISFRGAIVITF